MGLIWSSQPISKDLFYFRGNQQCPLTRYCQFCGCERFPLADVITLSNPQLTYSDFMQAKFKQYHCLTADICNKEECEFKKFTKTQGYTQYSMSSFFSFKEMDEHKGSKKNEQNQAISGYVPNASAPEAARN